jgi:hypothetical protein
MVKELDSRMVAVEEFGCFVSIFDGTPFCCPMDTDGTPDVYDDGFNNWGELTAPEDQKFLDVVNKHFGTAFRLDQFAGR